MVKFKIKSVPHKYRPNFMRELDKRSSAYLRLAASYERLVNDLGGNYSALSHTTLSCVERFCWLEETIRTLELRIQSHPEEAGELAGRLVQAGNNLMGLAKVLGLKKLDAKVPSLKSYLAD